MCSRDDDPTAYDLSARERDVLAAVARTGDQRAAASSLGISYQTYKNHTARAYRKLGVHGAIAAFVKLGWLRGPRS